MTKIVLIFLIASIFEISGCYFICQWLKNNKGIELGIIGIILLTLYGFTATLQTETFGKVYVVYGGIFIIMSLIWAYLFDNYKADKLDIFGTTMILI